MFSVQRPRSPVPVLRCLAPTRSTHPLSSQMSTVSVSRDQFRCGVLQSANCVYVCVCIRAGNEPSRSLKFHNGEVPYLGLLLAESASGDPPKGAKGALAPPDILKYAYPPKS